MTLKDLNLLHLSFSDFYQSFGSFFFFFCCWFSIVNDKYLPNFKAEPQWVTVDSRASTVVFDGCSVWQGVWFPYEVQDVTTTKHTHSSEDNKRPQTAPACGSGFCLQSEADGSVYYFIPCVEWQLAAEWITSENELYLLEHKAPAASKMYQPLWSSRSK